MPQGIVVMREWEDLGRAACHEILSASRRVTKTPLKLISF